MGIPAVVLLAAVAAATAAWPFVETKWNAMENLFERALTSTGPDYVKAERELRRQVASGVADSQDMIKQGAKSPDPLAPLLAEVLLAARGTSEQDYANLEQLFVNLPAHAAKTPLGEPSPDMFAGRVTRVYGDRATKFLALRLAKQPEWPDWLVQGVLLYLETHKDPATTPAILRFAITSPYAGRRVWARETLAKMADPALPQKLAAAQRWAEARNLPIPAELLGIPGRAQ